MNNIINIANNTSNPFSDSQARNYSDNRVLTEFCPTSLFWSLFNDQHEVVLGARGCGKTILLKMMRYSLLRKNDSPYAKKIVKEKQYIAFYIPLHLEFIKRLSNLSLTDDEKINWFRFSFNCVLAQSVLSEIKALIEDVFPDELNQVSIEYQMAKEMSDLWGIISEKPVHQFQVLRNSINQMYYNFDPEKKASRSIPSSFIHSLGSSLTAVSDVICSFLNISPTWILCVDEAEFIDECYQRCINTAFRSDTNRIAIKLATLPFYYITTKTLDDSIEVMNGQDFKYTILALRYDDDDFVKITDAIVCNRLAKEGIQIRGLNDFALTLANDNYIDYYKNEMGEEKADPQYIKSQIMDQISISSKLHNEKKPIQNYRSLYLTSLRLSFM